MTDRKPPGVRFGSWVEQVIQTAKSEGAFDDLPGEGKPLADLEEAYDPDWWAKKLIAREKISLLPPALQIRRRVAAELPRILKLVRERDVRLALAKLNDEIARVNRTVFAGPSTGVAVIDVDDFVAEWRDLAPDSR